MKHILTFISILFNQYSGAMLTRDSECERERGWERERERGGEREIERERERETERERERERVPNRWTYN